MTRYDTPDSEVRERFREVVAYRLRNYKGESLELRTSDEKISLMGSDNEEFYDGDVRGDLTSNDALYTIEDLIGVTRTVGFSQSLFSKFLWHFWILTPQKIKFYRHQKWKQL